MARMPGWFRTLSSGMTVSTLTQAAQMHGIKSSPVHSWPSRSEMRVDKGASRFISSQQNTEFYSRRKGAITDDYVDYTYQRRKPSSRKRSLFALDQTLVEEGVEQS